MKITDLKTFVVGNPWKNWVFVKLETDEGLTGLGEATGGLATKPVVGDIEELVRHVIGADPRHPERLWFKLHNAQYQGISNGMSAHLHASIPNFLIQENFDDSLEPWTWEVLSGTPRVIDAYLTVPDRPGWGVELNEAEAQKHPYNETYFLRLFEEGWETRRPPDHPLEMRPDIKQAP
jgi:L-alanine-DL-glutamate epimerase-like enolase superfamily enzyme